MKKLIPTLVLASAASLAAAGEPNTGVYVPFGVMVYDYDDSVRVLETDILPTLGVGYRFDRRWATELMVADGSSGVDMPAGQDADVRHYRLDGLYFMDDISTGLTPYAVGGIGENRIKYDLLDTTTEDTLLDAGMGLMYAINDNFSVRGDVRAIHILDEGNTEAAANLLVQYSFGSTSKPAAPVAPADDDRDGVANTKDRCPKTPPNKTVDKNGCDCNYVLHLGFAFDSAELLESDKSTLSQLRDVLDDLGYARANVVGYTDSMGEEAYNKELSTRRAKAVADYLGSKGVNSSMLNPEGRGESEPMADNSTEEGRAQNRRVVIERTDCGK